MGVHEDQGGIQPDIESLKIPKEVLAPIESWLSKCAPDLPDYIGREKLDAEGLVIATKLQQALGERIHVNFRRWIAFDKKSWRSKWREENLLSGSYNEFWMDECIPDDQAIKVVKIYPDCGGAYLWDLNGMCIGNDYPAFPDDLNIRFTKWSERWDDCFDPRLMQIDKARLTEQKFDQEGISLAAELKRHLGHAAKVVYYCTLDRSAMEITESGETIETPFETDFRQWVLDRMNDDI